MFPLALVNIVGDCESAHDNQSRGKAILFPHAMHSLLHIALFNHKSRRFIASHLSLYSRDSHRNPPRELFGDVMNLWMNKKSGAYASSVNVLRAALTSLDECHWKEFSDAMNLHREDSRWFNRFLLRCKRSILNNTVAHALQRCKRQENKQDLWRCRVWFNTFLYRSKHRDKIS